MKGARTFHLLAIILLLAMAMTALAVAGGTQNDPEFSDAAEDSTTNRPSHDIVRGWVTDENSTIEVNLEMTALDTFSPVDDWRTLPNSIYEFYFSVEDKDYAARANIPVHGIFAAFASFSLYEVTYNGGDRNYTSVDDSIGGTYSVADNTISMTVDKANVGEPLPGELLTHLWGASFFQPRNEEREEVDKAMSYTAPGRDYIVTGSSTHYYSVELRARNATVQAKPREAASFNISIVSKSTADMEVNLTNSTLGPGFFINFSRQMPIPLPQGDTVNVMVLITTPDNATNGTNQQFYLTARWVDDSGQDGSSDNLNLIVQVRFIPPRPPEEKKGILSQLLDIIKENSLIFYILIGAVAAIIVYFVVKDIMRKKKDQDILEYQAYLESQRQQRETGGF
jgi:hypothetical protein